VAVARMRAASGSSWRFLRGGAAAYTWHVERCRTGSAMVCIVCAPTVRLELQERLCAATLDLIDALPPEETRHLESIFEQLERAAAFRVPMSGQPATLAPFAYALAGVMAQLERLDSPIEYSRRQVGSWSGSPVERSVADRTSAWHGSAARSIARGDGRPLKAGSPVRPWWINPRMSSDGWKENEKAAVCAAPPSNPQMQPTGRRLWSSARAKHSGSASGTSVCAA
jgi:hypothetical protein